LTSIIEDAVAKIFAAVYHPNWPAGASSARKWIDHSPDIATLVAAQHSA